MQIEATMMPEEYRYKKVLLFASAIFFRISFDFVQFTGLFYYYVFCIFFRYGFCAMTATILLKSTST